MKGLNPSAPEFKPKTTRVKARTIPRLSPSRRRRLLAELLRNPPRFTRLRQKAPHTPVEDDQNVYSIFNRMEDPQSKNACLTWSIFSTEPEYPNFKETNKDRMFQHSKIQTTPLTQADIPENYFTTTPDYMDTFEDVCADLSETTVYKDNEQISITYLGKENQSPGSAVESFDIDPNSTVPIKFHRGPSGRMLLDSGASKAYMPLEFYKATPSLQILPKVPVVTEKVIVGNGEYVKVHFAILVTITVMETHRFEIVTLVSDISPSYQLILGLKNMVEIEGTYVMRNLKFRFLNRSPFLRAINPVSIAPKEEKVIPTKIMFPHKVTSKDLIIKLFCKTGAATLKVECEDNIIYIHCTNTGDVPIEYHTGSAVGIADLRSIGYYQLPGSVVTEQLATSHTFANLQLLCDEFNGMLDRKHKKYIPKENDPFPWLAEDDWRKHATDEEIFRKQVDLSKSHLSKKEKTKMLNLCQKYREAFSLRDEVGVCPKIKIHIDMLDKTPFFVRPFPIAEEDKPLMDWQMERMVHLGILSKNSTTHTSPVMLLSRKLTPDKRLVVDFRQLNSRVMRRNTTTPLLRDVLTSLGRAKVEVLSVLDLKDAYHSLRLDDESKEYCGIVPYFGADCYRYERMPMGLSISPAMWLEYLSILLQNLKNRDSYIAIMDDLLIFGKKINHFNCLEELFQQCIKHGLKISPRKCQFFVTNMVYLGNEFTVKGNKISMKPMKSRCEAIRKVPPPKTPKECKSFCGMVNFLSIFCPNLQKTLQPIYDLTKKGKVFKWTEEHQEAFEATKEMLSNPPVLQLPVPRGRFTLYTDTSRTHAGSALWQVQDGQNKLIGYASKALPEAAKNYSVTELEMKGMLTGMMTWTHFIGKREFDCAIDHQAVVYIMKAKAEPPTRRILRLLEALAAFNFKLYYVKGKDLILADYLSRANIPDEEDPRILVPISIDNRHEVKTYSTLDILQNRYNAMTRGQAKQEGLVMPKVHGANKPIDPHKKPEKQKLARPTKRQTQVRPTPIPQPQTVVTPSPSRPEPRERMTRRPPANTPNTRRQPPPRHDDSPYINGVPVTGQTAPPRPFDVDGPPIEVDITHSRPGPENFVIPPNLLENVDLARVIHKNLPKQANLDKLLKQIQHKILRDTHLPLELKDLEKHYLESPHFRDIYSYLNTGKLPKKPREIQATLAKTNSFILIDKMLFLLIYMKDGSVQTRLCIPTSLVDKLLFWYHTAIVGGHMGIGKVQLTINRRFHCPDLARHIRAYIIGCHTCQMFKKNRETADTLNYRITLDTKPMLRLSMDIKHMNQGKDGYNYILVVFCELSNFMVASAMQTTTSTEICKTLVKDVFRYFALPSHIICDQDPAFMSSLCQFLWYAYRIVLVTVGPTNHRSLKAEAGIKSLSNLLKKHLTGFGTDWPDILPMAMMSYNSFGSTNLQGYSPFELVFGRPANINPNMEQNPDIVISASYKEQYETLVKQLKQLHAQLEAYRVKRTEFLNKDRIPRCFEKGQLVYIYNPEGAILRTGSKKIRADYVGPLVIYKVIASAQYILMSVDGKIIPRVIEQTRLKPGYVQTATGNTNTLAGLKAALRGTSLRARGR